MKTVETQVVQDVKRAVQAQFSHFYKVMGAESADRQGRNDALALVQRVSGAPSTHPNPQQPA